MKLRSYTMLKDLIRSLWCKNNANLLRLIFNENHVRSTCVLHATWHNMFWSQYLTNSFWHCFEQAQNVYCVYINIARINNNFVCPTLCIQSSYITKIIQHVEQPQIILENHNSKNHHKNKIKYPSELLLMCSWLVPKDSKSYLTCVQIFS